MTSQTRKMKRQLWRSQREQEQAEQAVEEREQDLIILGSFLGLWTIGFDPDTEPPEDFSEDAKTHYRLLLADYKKWLQRIEDAREARETEHVSQ